MRRVMTKSEEDRARCLNAGSVTRYVGTYVKADGMRTLMSAAQGRDTYATEAEAQAWVSAVMSNNSANTLKQI